MPPYPFSVVTIDIGGTKIAGGVVTYAAEGRTPSVSLRRSIPTCAASGGPVVLERAAGLIGELLDSCGGADADPGGGFGRVLGIGVDAAGSINEADGSVAFANEIMPGWTGQPIRAHLEARFGVPCAVLNDVHAHALGELRHGAARGAKTAIVVAAGTGLGGALIVDGRLHGGAHGFAGMLGHTLHHAAEGIRCACGIEGHLESVASGSGIEARYRDAVGAGPDAPPLTGPQISQLANDGDPVAKSVIELAGRSLGEAIASWASALDPDTVIVSGSVTNAGPLWRAALEDGMRSRLVAELASLTVKDAVLGGDAPLIGAAERLLDRLAASSTTHL